jgi:hypothetical protein
MHQALDYRDSAADALTLAQRATNPSDKVRLLGLAQRWIALAERAGSGRGVAVSNYQRPRTLRCVPASSVLSRR